MEKEDVFVGVKRCCVRLVVVVSPVCCRCWAVLVCRCSAAVPPCCCSPAHRWRLVRSGTGWGTGGSCTGSPTGSGSLDWGPPSNAAAHTASPAGGTVTPLFSIISSIKTFDELFDTLYVVVSRFMCVLRYLTTVRPRKLNSIWPHPTIMRKITFVFYNKKLLSCHMSCHNCHDVIDTSISHANLDYNLGNYFIN